MLDSSSCILYPNIVGCTSILSLSFTPSGALCPSTDRSCPLSRAVIQFIAGHSHLLYSSITGNPPSRTDPGVLFVSGVLNASVISNAGSLILSIVIVLISPVARLHMSTSLSFAHTLYLHSNRVSSWYHIGSSPQASSHNLCASNSISSSSASSSAIGSFLTIDMLPTHTSDSSDVSTSFSSEANPIAPALMAVFGGFIDCSFGQFLCSCPASLQLKHFPSALNVSICFLDSLLLSLAYCLLFL